MQTRQRNSIGCVGVLLMLLVLLGGCGKRTTNDVAEYLAWANDPGNGVVQTKRVAGLNISVRYLSPEYRAYLELRSGGKRAGESVDSLIGLYEHSLGFMMTISAPENEGDVMMRNISSYSDYAERITTMNFDMSSFITLVADGRTYRPILATLDNGISPSRTVIVVFADEEGGHRLVTSESLDLIFSDTIFETGVDHFLFDGRDIEDRLRLQL